MSDTADVQDHWPGTLPWSGHVGLAGGALQVEEVDITWGFDGHVVEGRFNPVSILVTNPEGRPFEGVLEASPVSRLGDIVTAGFSEGAEGY